MLRADVFGYLSTCLHEDNTLQPVASALKVNVNTLIAWLLP